MGLLDKLNQLSNKMNEVANSVTGAVNNQMDRVEGMTDEAMGKVDSALDQGGHSEDEKGTGNRLDLGGQPCGVYLSNGNEVSSLEEANSNKDKDILSDI